MDQTQSGRQPAAGRASGDGRGAELRAVEPHHRLHAQHARAVVAGPQVRPGPGVRDTVAARAAQPHPRQLRDAVLRAAELTGTDRGRQGDGARQGRPGAGHQQAALGTVLSGVGGQRLPQDPDTVVPVAPPAEPADHRRGAEVGAAARTRSTLTRKKRPATEVR
ncbi:hypothetical protein MSMEG_3597 [Mycolicibacterium smegmatis MC2 155]|uniref:Uncharacterized protein n=1 Tax=Mycolicibacterium smegmatis (strain ATCC 700084 / mc(2)155) TaxID=246196 RepID=A0QYB2_MYCS2|nr:hypothetical protein MSMEG_3597 [Mycolicibacterium smegmatis MC2 155]